VYGLEKIRQRKNVSFCQKQNGSRRCYKDREKEETQVGEIGKSESGKDR
jgi:hypothetical protein